MSATMQSLSGQCAGELPPEVVQPIAGSPSGKDFLSINQCEADDIYGYLEEAAAAERAVRNPARRGAQVLPPYAVLKAVMRQPSTRTGGSMTTAMHKLGGSAELISGMGSSSEAKGESLADSWVAFATQADIIGTRTAENGGPALAAEAIDRAYRAGKLWQRVPVINLGDGTNEHPTQTMGDMFTIYRRFKRLDGLTATVVGDHERYRAHHSFMLAAKKLGMTVIAVESSAAPVPHELITELGDNLQRTDDLDEAMRYSDVVVLGRNPDEYSGDDAAEQARSRQLAVDYAVWRIDRKRLQQLRPDGMLMHPRPRRDELDPSVDDDPRAADVEQMANMIPMRMAIIAGALGRSVVQAVYPGNQSPWRLPVL